MACKAATGMDTLISVQGEREAQNDKFKKHLPGWDIVCTHLQSQHLACNLSTWMVETRNA